MDFYLHDEVSEFEEWFDSNLNLLAQLPDVKLKEPDFNKEWLMSVIQTHIEIYTDSLLSSMDLSQKILSILMSDVNDEILQSNLVDLIGFDDFDLLLLLVNNRRKIVDTITRNSNIQAAIQTPDEAPSKALVRKPVLGPSVIVNTQQEKAEMKKQRKDQKRKNKMNNNNWISNLYLN